MIQSNTTCIRTFVAANVAATLLAGVLLTCTTMAAAADAMAADGTITGTPAQTPLARQISWEELLPEGWVPPSVAVDHFFDAAPPQAVAAMDAPVVTALNGVRIRLPGYLVPITLESGKLKEFLMVPYFGACIHVPPPPPNQVVFVRLAEAQAVEDPYGPHWVTGVLATASANTELAETAYTLSGELIEVFDWEAISSDARGQQARGQSPDSE